MRNNKAFTITELLITLFILGVVLAAAYFTYINLLKGFKQESEKISTQIDNLVGLEILRLDLEHMGYGIAKDETSPIIEWNDTNDILTIRSTLNNTKSNTRGYIIAKCNSGQLDITVDSREDTSNDFVTIISIKTQNFFDKGQISGSQILPDTNSCSDDELYIAFPIRDVVYNDTNNGCNLGYCEKITYELSSSTLISRCNPNTFNLIRKLGNNDTGEPVLNCVADWEIRFDIDTNGNGKIDTGEENQNTVPTANIDIRSKLKRVTVYILVQEGRYDSDFTFTGSTTIDGITLNLPANYKHYRWKVLKLSVKPMDL